MATDWNIIWSVNEGRKAESVLRGKEGTHTETMALSYWLVETFSGSWTSSASGWAASGGSHVQKGSENKNINLNSIQSDIHFSSHSCLTLANKPNWKLPLLAKAYVNKPTDPTYPGGHAWWHLWSFTASLGSALVGHLGSFALLGWINGGSCKERWWLRQNNDKWCRKRQ